MIDTHCHIHSTDYSLDADDVLARAKKEVIEAVICVGVDEKDSAQAIKFAKTRDNVYASIGLHPHDAKLGKNAFDELASLTNEPKVIAIGECGLDYFYNHSDKKDQEKALRFQIELALAHNKPMIFHVRDAFEDFWQIFDDYTGITGVIHSFTATTKELDQALSRGLYVGLNGIMTFTKDSQQLKAAQKVPLERLVLETDAPFLTPVPFRGKINEPKNIRLIAEFLSGKRGENLSDFTKQTTLNTRNLFGI
jgi:TatD DNase family protein